MKTAGKCLPISVQTAVGEIATLWGVKVVVVLFLASAFGSIAAFGQGQFVFNNRVLPDINARFVLTCDPPGTSSIGTDYTVLVLAYEPGGQVQLAVDPPSTTFRGPAGSAAAGYVIPTTETVSGAAPGSAINVALKVVGPLTPD